MQCRLPFPHTCTGQAFKSFYIILQITYLQISNIYKYLLIYKCFSKPRHSLIIIISVLKQHLSQTCEYNLPRNTKNVFKMVKNSLLLFQVD